MDKILTAFADVQLASIQEADLIPFKNFLQLSDDILYDWIMEKAPVTPPYISFVDAIKAFHKI